jgi:glutaredoxin 2
MSFISVCLGCERSRRWSIPLGDSRRVFLSQDNWPLLTGPERGEIAAWSDKVVAKTGPLTMPRYPLLGLPEFATAAAHDHYTLRKRKTFGDFVELRALRWRC